MRRRDNLAFVALAAAAGCVLGWVSHAYLTPDRLPIDESNVFVDLALDAEARGRANVREHLVQNRSSFLMYKDGVVCVVLFPRVGHGRQSVHCYAVVTKREVALTWS